MADHPLQTAIDGLKNLVSEAAGLKEVAAEKIQKLTSELEALMEQQPPPRPPFDGDPIERIKTGFMNFRDNDFDKDRPLYCELAKGQQPKFLVFACSDSRVSPTFILKFIPGEAFMARNIANLVPPFDLDEMKNSGVGAIIEYAVTALKVENIVVIGHSLCGGIERLMTLDDDPSKTYDFIDDWVKIATPAKDYVNEHFPNEPQEERNMRCEKEAVNVSLRNLESYPYVRDGVEMNSLKLMGAYYDFVKGEFLLWPKEAPHCPMIIPPPPPPPQE